MKDREFYGGTEEAGAGTLDLCWSGGGHSCGPGVHGVAQCVSLAKTYVAPFGTIFLNLIRFIVVPIVIFPIIAGVISMKDIRKVGSVGVKTIVYYLCTTAGAVIIALILASLAKGIFPLPDTSEVSYGAGSVSFMDTIVNIFPSNPIKPLAKISPPAPSRP